MRKALATALLNKNKKPVKMSGTIVSSPDHLKYVVRTRTGKVVVDATQRFALADNVVIYDGVIHSKVGKNQTVTISTV